MTDQCEHEELETQLSSALDDAFLQEGSLSRLARIVFGERAIAAPTGTSLATYAQTHSAIVDLLAAALVIRPKHPGLRSIENTASKSIREVLQRRLSTDDVFLGEMRK